MRTSIRKASGNKKGFSLSEVACALGLLSIAMLPLLGVLAVGMDDARLAAGRRELGAMRTTMRQMLKNTDWPLESRKGGNWTASCDLDENGSPLMGQGKSAALASVKVEMKGGPAAGYESDFLESVRLVFTVPGSETRLGECVIQRSRRAPVP